MLIQIIIFAVSLGILLFSSDKFVASAERIGLSLGVPSFIIGVTIVAFGTSLPELATSIVSIYSGTSEVVIANAVGSNITNILLVIGAATVFGKGITLDYDIMNTDVPLLVGSVILLWFGVYDLHISTFECIIFLLALVIFLSNSFGGEKEEKSLRTKSRPLDWIILIGAAVGVYFSADFTIDALKKIAEMASIPPYVIAVTAVALGTSLPEVVVSINAAKRGQHGMAIGNVLGSNIFNTYAVIGIPGLLGELKIPEETTSFGVPFMIAVTILFIIVTLSKKINVWEGWLMILIYIFFVGMQFG